MPPRKDKKTAGRTRKKKPAAPETVPARRSLKVRMSLWTAALLLALFLLFLLISLLVFSPYRRVKEAVLDGRQYRTLSRVTSRVASQTFRRDPPAEARLRLRPDEVNDLLELARSASGVGRGLPPPWSFHVSYRPNGVFYFTVPLDAAPGWLFGGKIYARGAFRLEKQDEKLLLEIPELRLGRAGISIPGGGMFANRTGEDALKGALPPGFDEAVKEFYAEEDGTLVLVYRPAGLLPLLLSLTTR